MNRRESTAEFAICGTQFLASFLANSPSSLDRLVVLEEKGQRRVEVLVAAYKVVIKLVEYSSLGRSIVTREIRGRGKKKKILLEASAQTVGSKLIVPELSRPVGRGIFF